MLPDVVHKKLSTIESPMQEEDRSSLVCRTRHPTPQSSTCCRPFVEQQTTSCEMVRYARLAGVPACSIHRRSDEARITKQESDKSRG
jgi:hypothetical protein